MTTQFPQCCRGGFLAVLLTATAVRGDDAPETVSTDPFDSNQGTVIVTNDVTIDPINVFRTTGGFEDGHTLMGNGGLGSVSFIEFQTGGRVCIGGVRLFAKNDGAANGFRRALSGFRLLADLDEDGSFETTVVDSGAVPPDYSQAPGNAATQPEFLDLTVTNLGGLPVTAQQWRLEVTQGSDVQPFEGARIIEVDALPVRTLVVTSTDDNGPGTLREAVEAANVCHDTNTILIQVSGAIELALPLPAVTYPVTLLGPGPEQLTIRRSTAPGTPDFRVFSFCTPSAELAGVTVSHGRANVGAGLRNDGWLRVSNCVIKANTGVDSGCGGGILNRGDLVLIDSVVTGNTGEGSFFYGAGLEHAYGEGGNGLLRILRSVISSNHCEGLAGGLFVGGGDVEVSDSTISWNFANSHGGGAYFAYGQLRLLNSTVAGNGSAASGGGFYLRGEGFAATNCTFSGNTNVHSGGAMFLSGGGEGEGFAGPPPAGPGSVLVHCTITGNRTADGGGGLAGDFLYEARLRNTLLAGNRSLADSETDDLIPFVVPFVSLGHNLVGIGRAASGLTNGVQSDLVGTVASPIDPRLDPLGDNGGPTLTHTPRGDSPAVNAGANAAAPALDQRGAPRIYAVADIGAVELQGAAPGILCPPDLITNPACGATTVVVAYSAPAVTGFPSPDVECAPPAGGIFPAGVTMVHCTASNALGTNTCAFSIVVRGGTLTVLNTNDAGPGSLRQAILDANAFPCPDLIAFNIPGPGPHVIQPLAPLPQVMDPVTIDARTQPGYAGMPLIELRGDPSTNYNGLEIVSSNCVVAGLAFTHWTNDATALVIAGPDAAWNWVHGNYFGLDTTGTNIAANSVGIGFGGDTHHNLIGTDGDGVNDAAERNLISGNQYGFVWYSAYSNRIAGNYIGTDISGTLARGNQDAFYIDGSATGNIIGTDSSDDPFNANERNVISGNNDRGIILDGPNRVSGNFLGTDPTGAFAVPNQFGVQVTGLGSLVGSDGDGVRDDEERNVISGNSLAGIIMGGPETRGAVIRGNYIGTDASGMAALPNENGMDIGNEGTNSLVQGNLISGNFNRGIGIFNGATHTVLSGNLIGTDASGTGALGNGEIGVVLFDAVDTTIGGFTATSHNVIAFNGDSGVVVLGDSFRNSILGNSIFANGGPGIDLAPIGPTANDLLDADTGPNELQNFPEITTVAFTEGEISVQGNLSSAANQTFRLEFFATVSAFPGAGQARRFLGSSNVTTAADGNGPFSVLFSEPLAANERVSATSTDSQGNTSEISPGVAPQLILVVTNHADSGPGSLRTTVAGAGPGDTVTFAPGLSGQTILLTSGEIVVSTDLAIDGSALAQSVRIDGNQSSRIFKVLPGATVVLHSLTITNGFTSEAGGGVINEGTLTVNHCTMAGNRAESYGGGIENNGVLTVSGSTFFGNSGNGGGGLDNNGPLIVNQCTFFANTAGTGPGGGIWAGGTVAMTNCTMVGNIAAPGATGGIEQYLEAPIVIVNSIVAQNTNGNIGGSFTGGNNFTAGDPLLSPLGDFGGSTATMPPLSVSPVIDAGDNVAAASFTADQRGLARIFGPQVDIGAVEQPYVAAAPTIACEADATVGNDPFECSAVVNFNPTVTGVPAPAVVCTPPSGADLPVGTNVVTCTASNSSGMTNCSFTIIVQDTEAPELYCPDSFSVFRDPGQTSRSNVTFSAFAFDNCSEPGVVCTPPSGSTFPTGTNIVSCVTVDAAGNTNHCSFTVTVKDSDGPIIGGQLYATGGDIVVEVMAATAGYTSELRLFSPGPERFIALNVDVGTITNLGSYPAGAELIFGIYVRDTGDTFYMGPGSRNADGLPHAGVEALGPGVAIVGFEDLFGGGDLDYDDNVFRFTGGIAPLGCSTNIAATTDPGQCTAVVHYSVTQPDGATNTCVPPSGFAFPKGTNTVACTATYLDGRTAACSFNITVTDGEPPVITCQSNRVVECGTPWNFGVPTASDNCDGTNVLVSVVGTVTNALCGNTYSATRTWRATDRCTNSAMCSQTITVVDTTPPVLMCAPNRVVECGSAWAFNQPGVSDLCDGTNVLVSVVGTVTNALCGNTYSATRTWRATDRCTNSATCSQTITLRDTTPPVIVCLSNITVAESPHGSGAASVGFTIAGTGSVCDGESVVVCHPPSGSYFPVGVTTVTCARSDACGNRAECTFLVRVVPHLLPVTSAADAGPGTLRQALLDANAAPDENLIVFNLPGPAPQVIRLLNPLPAITGPVVLDATPPVVGFAPASLPVTPGLPVVELDGGGSMADGLVLSGGPSTVRGLSIYGFATAIRLQGGGNLIQGNFLGVDATGTNAPGNSASGLSVASARNTIGGTGPDTANVIGGNAGSGIRLETAAAVSNLVLGNFIGAGPFGDALGNGGDGLTLLAGASRNTIGRTLPGAGNLIAHNARSGVALEASAGAGNSIRGNATLANAVLGIDLGADGPTANDPLDLDAGPNLLQNFPQVTNVVSLEGVTTIAGTIHSATGVTLRLDFYVNDTTNSFGAGDGAAYIGSSDVATAGDGQAGFAATFPLALGYQQFITATATDPANNTSEFSPGTGVATPPVVVVDPAPMTNVPPGQPTMLCAEGAGAPPIFYQWRHNGVNIPGATNACYEIPITDVPDGGTYDVVIINSYGATLAGSAPLTLDLPVQAAADDFADAQLLSGTNGLVSWWNTNATREPGEPLHAGKPGSKSVWYKWRPTKTGITTVGTRGSTFDTLLAVYQGPSVSNLQTVAFDEDRGGFFTSGVRFNAYKGRTYYIAVDGYGGESGIFSFGWTHEKTKKLLPELDLQPQSQTVAPGGTAFFTVLGECLCGEGHRRGNCPDWEPHECDEDDDGNLEHDHHHHPDHRSPRVDYQWFLNGMAIPGATGPSLLVPNVQPSNLGVYTVKVSTRHRTVESQDAVLQINLTGAEVQPVQATDKFLDAALAAAHLRLGGGAAPAAGGFAPAAVVRGYTGSQIFNTGGSTTSGGEHPICGVLGGASQWFSFIAEETGTLMVNTDGSTYDTVMAIFKRVAGTNALMMIACDNTNGLDGLDSALTIPVEAGRTNFIVVDGVNSATGTLRLNYSLITPAQVFSMGFTPQKAHRVRYTGRPGSRFALQATPDFVLWTTLVTTNAATGVFDFTDLTSTNARNRYYRALLLP